MNYKSIFYLLLFAMLIFVNFNLKAAFATKTYSMSDDCYAEEGANMVTIECDERACWLICIGGGNIPCSFDCDQWCDGCDVNLEVYIQSNGENMFDYMHNQIELSNFQGTYVNNVIYYPTNRLYYRSISWSYNPITDDLEATLTITYEE